MNRSKMITRVLIGAIIILFVLLFLQINFHIYGGSGGSSGIPGYYYHTTNPSHPNEDPPSEEHPSAHPASEP